MIFHAKIFWVPNLVSCRILYQRVAPLFILGSYYYAESIYSSGSPCSSQPIHHFIPVEYISAFSLLSPSPFTPFHSSPTFLIFFAHCVSLLFHSRFSFARGHSGSWRGSPPPLISCKLLAASEVLQAPHPTVLIYSAFTNIMVFGTHTEPAWLFWLMSHTPGGVLVVSGGGHLAEVLTSF